MANYQVPLEPLPISDAERVWLLALINKRRNWCLKRLPYLQERLDSADFQSTEAPFYLAHLENVSYSLAMCDVLIERMTPTSSESTEDSNAR